ncbi:MAG: hypothetical protein V5A57_00690 [Candidatus Paceibacterota bacterium]
MKNLTDLKNIELGLILTLLAVGVLLPWHSPLLGGDSPSNAPSSGYKEVESGLLAKQTTIPQPNDAKPDFSPSITQGNTVMSLSRIPERERKEERKVKMILTAYSSTVDQTDSSPYTTASGARVRSGIVANNALPFGTKIKIPGLYGDKTFVVEDRLHWRKGDYHLDIWFPTRKQAINFGSKTATIEIVN